MDPQVSAGPEVQGARTRLRRSLVLFGVFALGLAAGVGLVAGVPMRKPGLELVPARPEKRLGARDLINPLLECETRRGVSTLEFSEFDKQLSAYLEKLNRSGLMTRIAVYYRDLNNGPWFGVNEDDEFRPGSLLKVPLMIGYLKRAEADPSLLQQTVTVDNPELLKLYDVQGVAPSLRLEMGKSYTLGDLIERMIIQSDNAAASLLESYDKHESLLEVAREMDLPIRPGYPPHRNVTLKEYAAFLRVLYNASYLGPAYSEWALRLMERSDFKGGLDAGVPEPVRVVHKFGEAVDPATSENLYNDCGIVYAPRFPYLLCMTVRGARERDLIEVARQVSAYVYEHARQ